MAEKMVGNGWEWLIDLGQGPVRTERKNGMRLRLRRWDLAGGPGPSELLALTSHFLETDSTELASSSLIESFDKEALVLWFKYDSRPEPWLGDRLSVYPTAHILLQQSSRFNILPYECFGGKIYTNGVFFVFLSLCFCHLLVLASRFLENSSRIRNVKT